MSDQSGSPLDALLRLIVMVGVVIVGLMAYHLYGPPLGEASEVLDRIVKAGVEAVDQIAAGYEQPRPTVSAAPLPTPSGLTLAPTNAFATRPAMPAVQLEPLQMSPAALPPLAGDTQSVAPLTENAASGPLLDALAQLGATDFHLAKWGSEGGWQRFECTVSLPGSAGFVRHFDAIEATSQEAIAQVARDVMQWRSQQSTPAVASVH